jgi:hypothetical protein
MAKQTNDFGSFKFLTGDVSFTDYGAKWVRKVGARRFHVIELVNWAETAGESAAQDNGKYNVSLSEIDLDSIPDESVASALESCGFTLATSTYGIRYVYSESAGDVIANGDAIDLALVECCHGYGCKAPLEEFNGNNWRKLMRAAISASRALDDSAAHVSAMARPVNAIGSTADEFMRGDISSAVLRGVAQGDVRAEILLKMGVK